MKNFYYLSLVLLGFLSSCSSSNNDVDNPDNSRVTTPVNYTSLFADDLCSSLKTGVTQSEINRCSDASFKKVAQQMLAGTYHSEFRLAEFKAYPDPGVQAASLKTSRNSVLDNPTGISVKSGDTLTVMMGDNNGYSLKLRMQNLNSGSQDGFNSKDEFVLKKGLNQFVMKRDGLVYVIYLTTQLDDANARPVKMHFISGTTNGYFDLSKDHGKWKERLAAAQDKYFDVLGKYAHLTFETADFRKYAADNGEQLIMDYDSIAHHEAQFMGLEKYNKTFRNRKYLEVIYFSYMYATDYRTAYNQTTMSSICNPNILTTSGCWGPAHEIGHTNQTRPGLKWLGTTEVTNNIMSQYIQTEIFHQPSRIQTESMGNNYRNRYSKAWNSIIVAGAPHCQFQSIGDKDGSYSSDVFCKLVPFWQLQLYFGKVLGRTPLSQSDHGGFYPDVYEYMRNHADQGSAGGNQTEFVYICSKLSGYNLLDFFTKWGFLTPVSLTLDDYGKGTMEVTQTRIDEIKSRVEALNLPKPDVALEYISDATVDLFKTKPAVVKGTAVREGNKLTFTGWQNVVAYEVTDATGKIIFISQGINTPAATAWFILPVDWNTTYKVYAVSATGNRTEVTF
jgi:hypothetical protein